MMSQSDNRHNPELIIDRSESLDRKPSPSGHATVGSLSSPFGAKAVHTSLNDDGVL